MTQRQAIEQHLERQQAQRLAAGISTLGLAISEAQQQQLLQYVALLHKWNRAYNLTAIRDPLEMVTRHLLDALTVVPHVAPTQLIDVGTGGGIPGIVLAIVYPELEAVLLDSNGKKTRFVKQVALELKLANVEVVHGRVEQYRRLSPQIISRAFASLATMVEAVSASLAPSGRLLAMKAATAQTDQELQLLAPDWRINRIPLAVPGLNEQRELVVLQRSGSDAGEKA